MKKNKNRIAGTIISGFAFLYFFSLETYDLGERYTKLLQLYTSQQEGSGQAQDFLNHCERMLKTLPTIKVTTARRKRFF